MQNNYDDFAHSYIKEEIIWIFYQFSRKKDIGSLQPIQTRLDFLLKYLKDILQNKNKNVIYNDTALWIPYLQTIYSFIGYTRDTFMGLGEHDITYMIIYVFFNHFPTLAVQSLYFILTPMDSDLYNRNIGCWRDIKYLCNYIYTQSPQQGEHELISYCISIANAQLHKDLETYKHSVNRKSNIHISNVAKHIPRENSKFSWLFEKMAIQWCEKYTPYILNTAISENSYTKAIVKSKTIYRKRIAYLNKALLTPQISFCNHNMKDFDSNTLTRHTYIKNSILLDNQNTPNFFEKLEKNNYEHPFFYNGQNYSHVPIEYIIRNAVSLSRKENLDQKKCNFLDILWKKYTVKQYTKKDLLLPIIDVSDCVDNDAFYAALGNALLISYSSHFQYRILAVDKYPTWISISPEKNIVDQVKQFMASIYNMSNTEVTFEKAFKLIASSMKNINSLNFQVNSIKLIIMSQFNAKCDFRMITDSFNFNWFSTFPTIFYWNFSSQCIELPENINNQKCILLSGYSPIHLYNILYKYKNYSKYYVNYEFLSQIVSHTRFSVFKDFINFNTIFS
tara:strand:- start:4941 stop:6626 length:1686 start_codon:yes stop_codon:yes gene_type:complete